MPRLKRTPEDIVVECLAGRSEGTGTRDQTPFDPRFIVAIRSIVDSGLTPTSALDLLARLMVEVPASSKEGIEQIKMMDKLLNTARAMMETRLKNEEAAEIASRMDEMEVRLQRLAAEKLLENKRPAEVWNGARADK